MINTERKDYVMARKHLVSETSSISSEWVEEAVDAKRLRNR
jgi:hypothetical protein